MEVKFMWGNPLLNAETMVDFLLMSSYLMVIGTYLIILFNRFV